MNKYLIFRTDRIGDFIFSRIITHAIKKKNPNNIIDFVCSSYNSNYIKNFKDINRLYILDKYDLKLMIKNFLTINSVKYDYLIILDSKRRSFFFSIFLKAKYKIALLKDWKPYILLKIFFHDYIINSEVNSQFKNFTILANSINLKINGKIDYYKNYSLLEKNLTKDKGYLLFHLDEKWFDGFYHSDYKSFNLNNSNFDFLINALFNKFKKKIIITCGKIEVPIFDKIISKNFKMINQNKFVSTKYNNKLKFFKNSTFQELELFVKNSAVVFCCEGAISHISHCFNKKTFAFIDNFITGMFWTDHMQNITLLKRDNIKNICNKIKCL